MSEARKEKRKTEELARRREQEAPPQGQSGPLAVPQGRWVRVAPARPLGSAPARRLPLLRARLAAPGSSALPGRGRSAGRPATTSGARASRLQRRRFCCARYLVITLWPPRRRR